MPQMAYIAPVENGQANISKKVEVHFNPQTLSVSYNGIGGATSTASTGKNNTSIGNRSSERTGFASSMSVELLFDTTTNGMNVRNITLQLIGWLQMPDRTATPKVLFHWGSFMFYGRINSISESLEYFSEQGTPLRATVNMSLESDPLETHDGSGGPANISAGLSAGASLSAGIGVSAGLSASAGISAGASFNASAGFSASAGVGTQPLTFSQSGQSMQAISAQAGVNWKAAASANNIDNPRLIQPGTILNLNIKTK